MFLGFFALLRLFWGKRLFLAVWGVGCAELVFLGLNRRRGRRHIELEGIMKKVDILARAAMAAVVAGLGLALTFGEVFAQGADLPSTIVIGKGGVAGSKVTFYDFHSDRSNPEFEQPHDGSITTYGQKGLRTGMVAATLDANNKPQIGPRPYRNYGIAHWFRDWNTYTGGKYGRNQNLAPSYSNTASYQQWFGGGEWNSNVTYNGDVASHDTSFKNIVIDDIPLTLNIVNRNDGSYEYSSASFFMLDGRGFGNEWPAGLQRNNESGNDNRIPNHNFSFTMELEFPFQVKSDMSFSFRGDDDVWVFIDNRLVLDLGGIHEPCTASFNVTRVLDGAFKVGENRTLRMFYVERHTSDANIRITTNIVAPPDEIRMSTNNNRGGNSGNDVVAPNGSIGQRDADEKTTLFSVVKDDNGNVMDTSQYNCANVTWTIKRADGTTVTKRGCSVVVDDSLAGTLNVTVSYSDGNKVVTSSANMRIYPLEPAFVVIQKDTVHKKASSVVAGTAHDDIYFGTTENAVPAFAVLYDKYGNKVEWNGCTGSNRYCPTAVIWKSTDEDIATFKVTSTGTIASVLVQRETKGEGNVGKLEATFNYTPEKGGNVLVTDRVEVGSKGEPGIAVGPNPFVPGRTTVLESLGPKAVDFYKTVPGIDGAGVLIAVEGAKPLKPGSKGRNGLTSYGKVVIYDAVGNIVLVDALYESAGASRAYGFVWDGKNKRGRNVGPGTYLVRVTGEDGDGNTLKVQKKVGVTK